MAATCVLVIVMATVMLQLYTWIPYYANQKLVAQQIHSYYSLPFKIHNYSILVALVLLLIANCLLVQKEFGKWYHVVQWIVHWIVLAPIFLGLQRFQKCEHLYIVASKGKS